MSSLPVHHESGPAPGEGTSPNSSSPLSRWSELPSDDQDLLRRAESWPLYASLNDLSHEALIQLARDESMDFAVAVLYTRLLREPHQAALYARVQAARRQPPDVYRRPVTLAFCPGAYYREVTKNGADGRVLREAAAPYVHQAVLIPTGSMSTVAENGEFLCGWLMERPEEERIVLASLSKGSSDIKAALSRPEADAAFRNVIGWINVSGVLNGLPIFNWFLQRPLMTLGMRLLFWSRGMSFRIIPDLRWGVGETLDFPLRLPSHLRLLSVVGFPLARHVGHPHLKANYHRMAPWGPNDGLMLLWDSCQLPGLVYPVWGADHFLRPGGDSRALANVLAGILVEELTDHACTSN